MPRSKLSVDGARFRDSDGREVTLRGINVAADAKFPRNPDQPTHIRDGFFDGDNVSFVGRPFNEVEARVHFGHLKRWGYNTIRYIFTWEALEHAGPGKYDEEFISHTISLLRLAKEYDLYIFMDPHQDVWSRFSGGSGAPMWTLYACGLDPRSFAKTQAAMVHNTWPQPSTYPKMIWGTNYTRMLCQTMYTLFWAGKDFAPQAIIDGKNIQDYLQDHYIGACAHLARRIHEAGDLEDSCVIGWESFNEPHCGLVGWQDLTVFPDHLKMRKGTNPNPWQGLLSASGRPVEVDTYDFGSFGPYKSGKELVDPQGTTVWTSSSEFDARYGWKRDPMWKLGECIWAQHGVWDPSQDDMLKKDYFATVPQSQEALDYELFTNRYFMDHFRKYKKAVRAVHTDAIMFLQGAVLELPPSIRKTEDGKDSRLVYAAHFYDGLTLLNKHWNRFYNFDIYGFMRGKYWSPAFALKFGEGNIRKSFQEQLGGIVEEAKDYIGEHPVIFSEIGIPYDLDDKHAYKTGDYSSQAAAMDANHFAIEGSKANGFTLWTYTGCNNHTWGDLWNGEDLSIFSNDDALLPSLLGSQSVPPSANASMLTLDSQASTISPSNLDAAIKKPQISERFSNPSLSTSTLSSFTTAGLRAAEAYVRPSPHATHGNVLSYIFDLKNCTFTFSLDAPSPTPDPHPTEIFLPDWHFPPGKADVEISGGKFRIEVVDVDQGPGGQLQMLKWWHGAGEQHMTVKGVKRKMGAPPGVGSLEAEEDEPGYVESLMKAARNCVVM